MKVKTSAKRELFQLCFMSWYCDLWYGRYGDSNSFVLYLVMPYSITAIQNTIHTSGLWWWWCIKRLLIGMGQTFSGAHAEGNFETKLWMCKGHFQSNRVVNPFSGCTVHGNARRWKWTHIEIIFPRCCRLWLCNLFAHLLHPFPCFTSKRR